jgi:hypothetical protein
MGPFEMVVAIVAIAAIASIVKARYGITKDAKGNEIRVAPAADSGETKALQAEIRALKERIQVLERIATDSNRAVTLDQEIERLRDGAQR